MTTLANAIRAELTARADPVRAADQQAYMKSAMPFYGVPVPDVRKLTRALARRLTWEDAAAVSRELWDAATYREERYAALALTSIPAAKGRLELLDLHEYQARTGAWWDLVDEIAHRVADTLDAHPAETAARMRAWAQADTIWLRRLSIIGQLRRDERTDAALLTFAIETNATEQEFFIRKAIGWALRDYARVAPDWVRTFVAAHDLSPLSVREALKHL